MFSRCGTTYTVLVANDNQEVEAVPLIWSGFEQYQGMMHPMGPQGPMTPVPQPLVQCHDFGVLIFGLRVLGF